MTAGNDPAHEFASTDELAPLALMDGIRVRAVNGERITLGVFELEPGLRWAGKPREEPSPGVWPSR